MMPSSREDRKSFNIALLVGVWVIVVSLIIIAYHGLIPIQSRFETRIVPVCAGTDTNQTRQISEAKAWGARKSHDAAMKTAEKFCSRLASACKGTCSSAGKSTCHPAPRVIHEKQSKVLSWRLVDTRTLLEYDCPCTCEH